MSADNWGICPRCKAKEDKRQDALAKRVIEAYGTLPQSEYMQLLREAEAPQPDMKRTLREDYELGTDEDGEFSVTYRCGCTTCNYSFKYEYSQVVLAP
jgi:hypothetical protein